MRLIDLKYECWVGREVRLLPAFKTIPAYPEKMEGVGKVVKIASPGHASIEWPGYKADYPAIWFEVIDWPDQPDRVDYAEIEEIMTHAKIVNLVMVVLLAMLLVISMARLLSSVF